jgi:hypothetical protein
MQSFWKDNPIHHLVTVLLLFMLTGVFPARAQQAASDSGNLLLHPGEAVENWSSLSLANTELHAEKPVRGERNDFPQFTRELFQVKWRLGDPIDLYVIRPKGVAKPPVILYLYSYPSETDRFRDNEYCTRLVQGGFAAVGFVSALTGQRYTMRPMKEWFVSELQEALGTSVHDVQMVLNFLSQRDDLDMNKVGMFGTGSGATIAILSAAADSRIKAIDLLEPWGDWPDWMAKSSLIPENERPNYLKPEFLQKVAPLDPVRWLPQLQSRRIRIQNLADDTITPRSAQERIEFAAPAAVKVQRLENAQRFQGTASGGRIFQWIKDQLQSAQTQPTAEKTPASPSRVQTVEPGHDD